MYDSAALSVARWEGFSRVIKYADVISYLHDDPYDVTPMHHNALTPAGVMMLWKQVSGQAGGNEFYSNANAFIKVGDSSASVVGVGQPYDLQGVNVAYAPMDAGYPVIPGINSLIPGYSGGSPTGVSYNTCVWQATFGTGLGNGFNWREMGLDNASSISVPPTPTGPTSQTIPPTQSALPGTGTMFNRIVAPDLTNGWGNKVAGTIWVAVIVISIS